MTKKVDSLTLKVIGKDDSAISADSFLEVMRETISLLRDFDSTQSLKWKITSASMQSPLTVTLTAEQAEDEEWPQVAPSRRYAELFRSLDRGQSPENYAPDKSIIRAGRLVNTLNNGVAKIVMVAPDQEPVVPTQRVQATATELVESRRNEYSEITTLEGDLKTVSVSGGSKFFVFDRITGHSTQCSIPHERIDAAKELLEKRVWVEGRTKFKNGKPMRVEASDFGAMPDRKDLPQFSDVTNIDITGGEDSVTFVRRQRDAI